MFGTPGNYPQRKADIKYPTNMMQSEIEKSAGKKRHLLISVTLIL